jgi:hypothetical protein
MVYSGLTLHGGVEILVLLRVFQLDDERRRERILASHVFELRKLADGVRVCVIAVEEAHRFDIASRFDLLAERLARVGGASGVVGRDVIVQEHLRFDPVQVDRPGMIGQPDHQQTTAKKADRDRGGQDHRDRHGDVAAKPGQDLV